MRFFGISKVLDRLRAMPIAEGKIDLDRVKADIMSDDPLTYGTYSQDDLHGSLEDRVTEIIYNHAYEGASRSAMKPIFDLAKRERFLPAAEKAWKDGLEDGGKGVKEALQRAPSGAVPVLGEGPPYRITYVHSSDRDEMIPVQCDHCGALLTKKQVGLEDKEGREFVIGSSCAKNVGGAKLARWAQQADEEEAWKYAVKLVDLKEHILRSMRWDEVPEDFGDWRRGGLVDKFYQHWNMHGTQAQRVEKLTALARARIAANNKVLSKDGFSKFLVWLKRL